jgi:hypothetical protein
LVIVEPFVFWVGGCQFTVATPVVVLPPDEPPVLPVLPPVLPDVLVLPDPLELVPVTLIEKAGKDALETPSLAVITMLLYLPTFAAEGTP